MLKTIIKRDGKVVDFDKQKIVNAILPAMKEADSIDTEYANKVADSISKLNKKDIGVEDIQDLVEEALMKKYPSVARKYITYRAERTRQRRMRSDLMKNIKEKVTCSNNEYANANVDEESFGARKNESAGVMMKEIASEEMLDPEVRKAREDNYLYIHDFVEYPIGQHNCLNIDMAHMLKDGFYTRNGGVRGARSISTAMQLVAVIFQAQSQCQFGGAANIHIDRDLAPFVRISFLKHFKDGLKYLNNDKTYDEFIKQYGDSIHTASIIAPANIFKDFNEKAYQYALDMLEKEGLQAAQALFHNLNTLESRPGSQLPFTSINFGLDTSFEGRCVIKWLLNASLDGIGPHHLTPIFPISIWQYKKDINDRPGTPNYDLFKLAIKSTTSRIYPNYIDCDWISNVPDVHPTKLISNKYIDSEYYICIHTGKFLESEIDSKDTNGAPISLADFWNWVYKEYSVKEKDGVEYIDLRFLKEPIYVDDSSSSYKDYNTNINQHMSKINYICMKYDNENDKYLISLTTDSFEYDYNNGEKSYHLIDKDLKNHKYNPDTEMATMGCVDGKETIRIKINGKEYSDNFENIWKLVNDTYKITSTVFSENTVWINTDGIMKIYDSFSGGFINVKKLIRNNDMGRWYKVWFKEANENQMYSIFATEDHPLPTNRGRIMVKDLKEGDKLFKAMTNNKETYDVVSITKIGSRNRYEYDVETVSDHFDVSGINSHNCRTLIGYDRFGAGYSKQGRGNVIPATMNIAQLGIEYGICLGERSKPDLEGFNKALDKLLRITEKSLLDRYHYICSQRPSAAYFMYDNGTIIDADKSLKEGNVEPSMKHNTLALGYIGLSNALYALFGKYQDDPKARKFGNSVVKKIYDYAKDASERNNLNFGTYSTPAENSCFTIMKKMQKKYGKIKGVTDREYLNNSYHVPVYLKMSVKDKLDIESEYTWMSTSGCITYSEFDSSTVHNQKAMEDIIRYAMEENDHKIVYFAINFPIDNCLDCGYSGEINDKCPQCGSDNIQYLRRVTGYLTADYKTRFNKGKRAEVEDRVKHSRYTNFTNL